MLGVGGQFDSNVCVNAEGIWLQALDFSCGSSFCIQFFKASAHLSVDSLVTLLKCQLASQRTFDTETWKLFFQRVAPVLDQALLNYSSMVCACNPTVALKCCLKWVDFANTSLFLPFQASNISGPSTPQALNAIGELILQNVSSAQLQDATFVATLFQKRLRPFLASSSVNLLACLSSKNFSCQTYQIV